MNAPSDSGNLKKTFRIHVKLILHYSRAHAITYTNKRIFIFFIFFLFLFFYFSAEMVSCECDEKNLFKLTVLT